MKKPLAVLLKSTYSLSESQIDKINLKTQTCLYNTMPENCEDIVLWESFNLDLYNYIEGRCESKGNKIKPFVYEIPNYIAEEFSCLQKEYQVVDVTGADGLFHDAYVYYIMFNL